jgi:dihydroxyacetone kinase-like protein
MATLLATELTLEQACEWIRRLDAALREQRDSLTDLDAAIGGADHGINMERGFTAVRRQVEAAPPAGLGTPFKTVGATLISTVGGASGPLYGTAFLRIAGALAASLEA